MSNKHTHVKFSALHPGERYVMSLLCGSPLLVKLSESDAHLIGEGLQVNMAGNGEVMVFAIDRGIDGYGVVEESKIELGLYDHYERGLCDVFGTATEHGTEKTVVIFLVAKTGRVWTRPLEEFVDRVMVDGVLTQRFTKIDQKEP